MSGNNIDWPAFWAEHINVPGIVLRVDGSIVYPHTHKLVHAITSAPLGRIVTVAQVEDADTFEVHIEGKPFTFAQFTEDDVQAAIGAAEEFADGAVYCRLLPDGLVLVLKDTPANEGDDVVDRLHAIAQKAVPVLNSMA